MWADPEISKVLANDELIRQEELKNPAANAKGGIYTIPIVFHVLHNDGAENIPDQQIFNAFEILNRDFRAQNEDTSDVIPIFKPIIGDAEIEFVMATKAPNGDCFSGITRTKSPLTFQGNDGNAQVDAIRWGNDIYQGNWPSNKYLNIFIIADAGGAGGYTNYPNNWNNYDMSNGIWMLHTQFGTGGTSITNGRTITHECGHWLNLPHTWGSTNSPELPNNCNEDDGVQDTPLCMGLTYCPPSHNSCDDTNDPNNYSSYTFDIEDNLQNYMEYTFCSRMFTQGQASRMRAAAESSVGGRNNLWTTQNLIDTGADGNLYLCDAEFEANKKAICVGETIEFTDLSYNLVNDWQWTFTGGTPSSSTDQNPSVTYNAPGLYEVTLIASDGSITDTETKTAYVRVLPAPLNTPFLETFENFTTLSNIAEWEINNEQGNQFELESTVGHTGTKCARLLNYGESVGTLDELVAMPVDLSNDSTDLTLSFRYAYRRRNSSDDDYFRVYATKDCGDSWDLKKTLHGFTLTLGYANPIQSSPFTPSTADDWITVHIVNILSQHFVENFRYKFAFDGGGGNNFYLDNINIYRGSPSEELVVGLEMLEEDQFSNLRVYPNPVEEDLAVDFQIKNSQSVVLEIRNIAGQLVSINKINAIQGANKAFVSTKGMSSGVYFLSVHSESQEETIRFIVK